MADTKIFSASTPRFDLPLLYAAQAQKEIFVNEALARTDALLHAAVEGVVSAPPADAEDGQAWLIGQAASGSFEGMTDAIAARQSGNWLFIAPREGMAVFDRELGQSRMFRDAWHTADAVPEPTGGANIDIEARDAISALCSALRAAGILSAG